MNSWFAWNVWIYGFFKVAYSSEINRWLDMLLCHQLCYEQRKFTLIWMVFKNWIRSFIRMYDNKTKNAQKRLRIASLIFIKSISSILKIYLYNPFATYAFLLECYKCFISPFWYESWWWCNKILCNTRRYKITFSFHEIEQ